MDWRLDLGKIKQFVINTTLSTSRTDQHIKRIVGIYKPTFCYGDKLFVIGMSLHNLRGIDSPFRAL